MSFRCLTAAGLLIVASSLPAADDPLEAFPAETGIVLRVSSPSVLTTKAEAFLNKAAPKFAPLAGQIGPGVGSLIGNPTLAGVDANADLYVAGFPRTEQSPAVVYAVRASDTDAFKDAIGDGYTLVEYEGWMLYSLDGEAMKNVQSRIGGEGTSIRGSIPESLDPPFDEGELAFFLNVPVLREVYREQIEADRQRFLEKVREDQPPPSEGPDPHEEFADLIYGAIDDMVAFHGALAIAEDALRLHVAAVVRPESPSAKRLAALEPTALPLLAKLPQDHSLYFAAAGSVFETFRSAAALFKPLEDADESFDPAAKALLEHEIRGLAMSADAGGEQASPLIMLWDAEKPDEFLRDFRTFVQAKVPGKTDGDTTTVAPAAETVEGVKVDVVTIERESPADADSSAKLLDSYFAGKNATGRMGVVEGLFAYATGEGTMSTAIKAIRGQLSADPATRAAVEKSRKEFDEKLNLLLMADFPRLLRAGIQLAVEIGTAPLPVEPETLGAIEFAPSYTGASVVALPNELHGRIVLPAEQAAGLVRLFNVLRGAASRQEPAVQEPSD